MNPTLRQDLIAGIGSALQELDKAFLGVGDVVSAVNNGVADAKQALQSFSLPDIEAQFRTRVINVPKAYDQAVLTVQDLTRILEDEFGTAVAQIQQLIEGIRAIQLTPPPPNINPGVYALSQAANIQQQVHSFLGQFATAVTAIFDIAPLLRRIHHELTDLNPLFLQQGNKRSTVDEHYSKRQKGA